MIDHPYFTVEPWRVRATHLDLDVLAQTESVFALSNGHIGWRGNLDEGEPNGIPGAYLNGVWEQFPLATSEAGYGYPEIGQTVVNVTNGKLIRLLVDDEPFDVRYGQLHTHEQILDLRSGLLHRRVDWTSPSGKRIRVESVRLVSLVQRAIAAVQYRVQALGNDVRVVVQSELVANEALPTSVAGDPRVGHSVTQALQTDGHSCAGMRGQLVHHTAGSGLRLACAMDHRVDGPEGLRQDCDSHADLARVTFSTTLAESQSLRIEKLVAYGWSGDRSMTGLRAQVAAALTAARGSGWRGLADQQRQFLEDFWHRADVEVDGDAEVQQAVRFGLFHVLQAAARGEGRAIPAKGLTGPGYDGHTFWDTETFVLPVLTYTHPQAVAHALTWRHSTLPLARERAGQLGLSGAAFPWRTIAGQECSGYWPAGTAAFHVNADIADAVMRYLRITADEDFDRRIAGELLVHTARLWRSLGHRDSRGRFCIDGVTGPDEYSALCDNNVYTNLMAQQNLIAAAEIAVRQPDLRDELVIEDEEIASWRDAAAATYVPFDPALGVHPQADNFTHHEHWDFAGTKADQYPLLLHFPYFDIYRRQVVKQADLVLAMQLRSEAFTPAQKQANFRYYEAITVRDSSLSAATQAVLAAEIGALQLAHDYLAEVARIDLDDLQHNTREGLHLAALAALAGTWTALVAGFGGMRDRGDSPQTAAVSFAPRLPESLDRLAFSLYIRGQRLRVQITHADCRYAISAGADLDIEHHGGPIRLRAGQGVTMSIPAAPQSPQIRQPPHRAPAPQEHRDTEAVGETGSAIR